jgi:tRNA(Ile2) C34 agmatinyltransferase TiaS
MELVTSNKIEVSCDICGEEMKKSGDTWACYPCKHMLYESEVSDHQVTIIEEI